MSPANGLPFPQKNYFSPLNLCRNVVLGLKDTIRRLGMTIVSPVCGLRPLRSDFFCKTKLPNPEIFSLSPEINVFFMSSKTASTMSTASRFVNPLRSFTISVKSNFSHSISPVYKSMLSDIDLYFKGQHYRQSCLFLNVFL